MHDDRELANLLGQAPNGAESGFRIDVFARVAARARRRAGLRRGAFQVVALTGVGLIVALLQAAGATASDVAPITSVAAALTVAGVLALALIEGPKALLARSRAALRLAG